MNRWFCFLMVFMITMLSGCGEPYHFETISNNEGISEEDTELLFPAEDSTEVEQDVFAAFALRRSSNGFYEPMENLPNYDCRYGSANGYTYTTLWADNQDGGATVKASGSKYSGSYCDYYDNISGRQYNGEFCGSHPGVDIAIKEGTTVWSIWSGTVYAVDTAGSGNWGKYIILKISAYTSSGSRIDVFPTYAHLSSIESWVKKDATVSAGKALGKTGNTGKSTNPHLHFQIDKSSVSHPYWPSGAPDSVDWTASLAGVTYNPLTAIGFGTCY